jgi:ribosomal protein S18 acetylase RimI-like enzyme
VAVVPGRRHQGVGTALIQLLENDLRRLGCLKVNRQVRANNAGLIAFYAKLGNAVEPRVSLGKPLYK